MREHGRSGEAPDHNAWKDNTHSGPWVFQAYVQGNSLAFTDFYPNGVPTTLDFAGWQSVWHQDLGSTGPDAKAS